MKLISEYAKIDGSEAKTRLEAVLEKQGGILRLAPCWVPRDFLHPGRRLKLHPNDLYAYGVKRGGIDERWFSSTVEADNEDREPDEGLSYCLVGENKVLLRDAVDLCGAELVGEKIWSQYGRWPVLCKFFDNMGPIPLHMHQNEEQAKLIGAQPKPEAYYFPPQMNATVNNAPFSFFGLAPNVSDDQLRERLAKWDEADARILELSVGYQLELGTGWLVPPGVLHAPGSLCTYEPQWASDVSSMYQNVVEDRFIDRSMLVNNVPDDKKDDLDYLVEQIDWAENLDPDFKAKHFLRPVTIAETETEGYLDKWIVYGKIKDKQRFSAKELTIAPGAACTVKDDGAYGLICVQGHGTINGLPLSSPTLVRFRQTTEDEFFCSANAAREGVRFENKSDTEPLVCLRHFGPDVMPQVLIYANEADVDEGAPQNEAPPKKVTVPEPNIPGDSPVAERQPTANSSNHATGETEEP